MTIKNWNIEQMTGYKPITTFYMDFGLAEKFGIDAIKETYNRSLKSWAFDYTYITELVMVLNWKIWEHYENDEKLAKIYNDLWENAKKWVHEHFNEVELNYYYRTTD